MELAKQHDIKVTRGILEQMTTRASSFDEVKAVLGLTIKYGKKITKDIVLQASYRVTSFKEVKQVFEIIEKGPKLTNYELKPIVSLLFSHLRNWEEVKDFVNENGLLDKFQELKNLEYDSVLVKDLYVQGDFRGVKKIIINGILLANFDQNMKDSESAEIIKSLMKDDKSLFFDSIHAKLLKAIKK